MPFTYSVSFNTVSELSGILSAELAKLDGGPGEVKVAKSADVKPASENISKIPFKAKTEKPKVEAVKAEPVKAAASPESQDGTVPYEAVKNITHKVVNTVPGGKAKIIELFAQFFNKDDPSKKAAKGNELMETDYASYVAGAEAILAASGNEELA